MLRGYSGQVQRCPGKRSAARRSPPSLNRPPDGRGGSVMGKLNRRGHVIYGASLAAAIVGLGIGQALLQNEGRRRRTARCRRRASRSIRSGRSRCPTTGCSARRSASGPTSRTTSGSSTAARRRCTTTRRAPSSTRRSPNAAAARRRCSSSIRPATSCAPGAAPARATSGRSRTTASTSTTRATSGSAATARRTRTS